jgi:hypothetical protein
VRLRRAGAIGGGDGRHDDGGLEVRARDAPRRCAVEVRSAGTGARWANKRRNKSLLSPPQLAVEMLSLWIRKEDVCCWRCADDAGFCTGAGARSRGREANSAKEGGAATPGKVC